MNTGDSPLAPALDQNALQKLGRSYRLARVRYLLLLLVPLLWLLGVFIASLFGPIGSLASGILIAWFFLVLFGVGAWVFLLIPEKEEIKRKYVSHVLPF